MSITSRDGSFSSPPSGSVNAGVAPNTISAVGAIALTMLTGLASYYLQGSGSLTTNLLALAAVGFGTYGTGKVANLIPENPVDTTVAEVVSPLVQSDAARKVRNFFKKRSAEKAAAAAAASSNSTGPSAPNLVPRMYIGGIEVALDPADQAKYQELFYEVQNALKVCGKMADGSVTMTIDFYTGKGYYQDVKGEGAKIEFDIRHPNLSDPKYSPERYEAVQKAVKEFQDFCKGLSAKLNQQSAAEIAIQEAGLEGKVSPSDVTVDLASKTYLLKGDPNPHSFKPESAPYLEKIRESIDKQCYFIELYASLDDPEADRHPMGRAGNVGQIAKARLDSYKRWHFSTEMQIRAERELEDANNLLRDRLEFRTDVLRVLEEEIKEAQEVLEAVLEKIKASTTETRSLAVDQKTFEQHLNEVVKPIAKAALERLHPNKVLTGKDIDKEADKLKEKYKAYFKYIQAYVAEINERIKKNESANVEESIAVTIKALKSGTQPSLFIDTMINVGNESAKTQISSVITKTLGEDNDESSWKARWIRDVGLRAQSDKKRGSLALSPNQKNDYIGRVTKFETEQILPHLKQIYEKFSQGGISIIDCIEEEVAILQKTKVDPFLLAKELRRTQVQKVENGNYTTEEQTEEEREEEEDKLKRKKERLDLSQVFVDSPVNEFVCIKYRPRIQEPSMWEKIELSKSRTPWDRFQSCFEEAALEITTKTWAESMHGIVDWIYGASKEPSKEEKMQALFNAFALVVPSGNEGLYEKFVNAYNEREKTSYTLPHEWRTLKETAEAAIQAGATVKPQTLEDIVKEDLFDRKVEEELPLTFVKAALSSKGSASVSPSPEEQPKVTTPKKRTFNRNRLSSVNNATLLTTNRISRCIKQPFNQNRKGGG